MLKDQFKHIHCIGIGGIGVSAIAEILLAKGVKVSGSDLVSSRPVERLKKLGAQVMIGHKAAHVKHPDCVVYSSAISSANPEYEYARINKIPLVSRGEFLAKLLSQFQLITVSGTHGKTTTTSLIAHLLETAKLDPSYVIGGILKDTLSPVRLGCGEFCIAEVDESDASFLYMKPRIAVITNIDMDHLDTYSGCFEKLKQSFMDSLLSIPSDGVAILCIDDPTIRSLLPLVKCRVLTYGFSEHADVRACFFSQVGTQSEFSVRFVKDEKCLAVQLTLPGQHNVLNALAAVAIAQELKISDSDVLQAMRCFPGVARRFQLHGQMCLRQGCALVFEDYGHHPREIKATLEAAKCAWPNRRVVLVFQPHRYTRTRDLYHEFVDVLKEADKLYLVDIYSAGEHPLEGISSVRLAEEIAQAAKCKPDYIADIKLLPEILRNNLQDQDVVILQGAGNIGAVSQELPFIK